ncbi:MAG: thioredoxin family protein [Candidatus Marinimicrobia bacterium]|nr:thioredoxin family protein [Candidatus Neomarinimicrobiota bacterium]
MKKLTLLPIILFSGILFAEELSLGSSIPLADVKMRDISGTSLSLNDAKGKQGLLVIFSCNTCPWVIDWQDRYVSITNEFLPQGFGVIAVNSNEAYFDGVDSFEAMQKHAKKNGYNFYYTVDEKSQLAKAFGATRTPHIYLFDSEGTLVYRGAIDDNSKNAKKVKKTYLADAMNAILAGEPIAPASTKAFGCTIKFAKN